MLNQVGTEFCAHSGYSNQDVKMALVRAQDELHEAYVEKDPSAVWDEIADIVLVLATQAAASGVDLEARVLAKHAKNLKRKWGPHPTIPGALQHIKEGG